VLLIYNAVVGRPDRIAAVPRRSSVDGLTSPLLFCATCGVTVIELLPKLPMEVG